ncbi:molybdenum cofactor [Lineolata rhizophorae]|uniref:Adenylyltransferase and sulfurtransferase uba4 n=1 Tax=Lineolata rhizophorae TaxID=578093 RepID=A0A6A6NPR3_9PEZI|nr:molybdenum cofactor [Lineolata rhizophorae]
MTTTIDTTIHTLREEIASCETRLAELRTQLAAAEARSQTESRNEQKARKWPLEKDDYKRYGRQLILPEIGLQGQLRLKKASVLIVGVGGLGCPAAAYLAGAGVGTIGFVDGDTVDESNLHRQILHTTPKVGMSKVDSAIDYCKSLNPTLTYTPHRTPLTPQTALPTFTPYDLVLDCTDNPATRYLISDTCVLLCKPLVSASALRTDGQLMLLNHPSRPAGSVPARDSDSPPGGPCYRCVFPRPPPAASVVSCGEGGILGPVVGVMGVLQALEAIKLIAGGRRDRRYEPSLLLFSATADAPFRSVRLAARRPGCAACSARATVTRDALAGGSLDYVRFCGAVEPVRALGPGERVGAREYYAEEPDPDPDHVLVDVRDKVQFELCSLAGSINIPYSEIAATALPPRRRIYVVCRLGNDSQLAARRMKELGLGAGGKRWIGDIRGGLSAWREVDGEFPDYG